MWRLLAKNGNPHLNFLFDLKASHLLDISLKYINCLRTFAKHIICLQSLMVSG